MGLLRIKGELLKLGITVSATTIANVLRRGGLGPAPRRTGPTWSEFLRAQASAIWATSAPVSGPKGDQQDQARTLPASDELDRPSLEERCCPSEAPAAAPIGDPEQGSDQPRVLSLNRPSRMQTARRSPLSGANPRDGPAAARRRLGRFACARIPPGSHTRIAS